VELGNLAINGGIPVRPTAFPKWPVYDQGERKAFEEVLESGVWGIGGEKIKEFERKFAKLQQAEYGICVVNGTVSLALALSACGVLPGDEVIIPAYTFMATASSVLLLNAVPVFVDVEPDNYCINVDEIEGAISEKTKAIIPVHLAGHPADLDSIMKIAERNNLSVIEDACQAHLSEWKNRKVGAIGDLGCFSFQSSKNMTSGEGGIIITNNKDLADKCWSYHNCGRRKGGAWYEHPHMGWNFRMTEFQAAILLAQLERAESQTKIRNENAKYLSEILTEIDGINPLYRDKRVTLHGYHLFIMKYDKEKFSGIEKSRILEALNAEGIPCVRGYVPIHKESYLANAKKMGHPSSRIDYSKVICPVSEKACYEEALWLTQNVLLGTKADMSSIAEAILKVKCNIEELR
jgi:dTDP-4-amino-4,6-dideoxygalactose transaminase